MHYNKKILIIYDKYELKIPHEKRGENMSEKNVSEKTKKLVTSAMLTAIVCIATMVIKIPTPLKGYLNLGDCAVLLSGWILPPAYGFLAAGTGSAFADIFSGYALYAPATFIIKGVMALGAYWIFTLSNKKFNSLLSRLLSGLACEIIMVLGYFIFEGFLYGFVSSAVNIPINGIQGVIGLILGVLLIKLLKRL